MNRIVNVIAIYTVCLVSSLCITALGYAEQKITPGELLFKAHCSACHFEGGNIIRSDKTLARKDREKYGVKTANDIVNLMRNPGTGMSTFDKTALADDEAKAVAEYIITTFK
ncbi:MAG: c-type cytochrome [Deltaproteobacteria bacterium]